MDYTQVGTINIYRKPDGSFTFNTQYIHDDKNFVCDHGKFKQDSFNDAVEAAGYQIEQSAKFLNKKIENLEFHQAVGRAKRIQISYAQQQAHQALVTAVECIADLGGNLSDEALEKVGGINDGRDRAIKYVTARTIARKAILDAEKAEKEF